MLLPINHFVNRTVEDESWVTPVLDEVDDLIPRQGTRPRYRRSLTWLMLRGQAVPPAIAQRFSGVLDMFSSLEVKVLYST